MAAFTNRMIQVLLGLTLLGLSGAQLPESTPVVGETSPVPGEPTIEGSGFSSTVAPPFTVELSSGSAVPSDQPSSPSDFSTVEPGLTSVAPASSPAVSEGSSVNAEASTVASGSTPAVFVGNTDASSATNQPYVPVEASTAAHSLPPQSSSASDGPTAAASTGVPSVPAEASSAAPSLAPQGSPAPGGFSTVANGETTVPSVTTISGIQGSTGGSSVPPRCFDIDPFCWAKKRNCNHAFFGPFTQLVCARTCNKCEGKPSKPHKPRKHSKSSESSEEGRKHRKPSHRLG